MDRLKKWPHQFHGGDVVLNDWKIIHSGSMFLYGKCCGKPAKTSHFWIIWKNMMFFPGWWQRRTETPTGAGEATAKAIWFIGNFEMHFKVCDFESFTVSDGTFSKCWPNYIFEDSNYIFEIFFNLPHGEPRPYIVPHS